MGFCSKKAGSKRSRNTRPSMSSGTGCPNRYRSVGAKSINCAPCISAPFLNGLPWAIKIPSRRWVPPHSEPLDGFRSQISTAGRAVSSGKLGLVENSLSSHQSRIRSAASFEKGPWKISSRRKIRLMTGSFVRGSTADKVVANGVTINNGAQFSPSDLDSAVLPIGTVFTAVDNTAATSIAGTFANLADGSTFTAGSNVFQANYEGGDGNDLTLTVVP